MVLVFSPRIRVFTTQIIKTNTPSVPGRVPTAPTGPNNHTHVTTQVQVLTVYTIQSFSRSTVGLICRGLSSIIHRITAWWRLHLAASARAFAKQGGHPRAFVIPGPSSLPSNHGWASRSSIRSLSVSSSQELSSPRSKRRASVRRCVHFSA